MIGGALGLALLAGLAAARTSSSLAAGAPPVVALNDGYAAAFLLAAVLALVTAILAATQLHSVEPRSTSWEDTESTVDEEGELVGAGR
jgi:membrane protein implicated in regulation of membrane protease activity